MAGRPATPMYPRSEEEELCADGALDVESAAERCKLSVRTIKYAIAHGEIETFKVGTRTLIPTVVFTRWLAAHLAASRAKRGRG